MTVTPADINYLKVLENGPFSPLGWLYESIYSDLEARQLVLRTIEGFQLSDTGRKVLQDHG